MKKKFINIYKKYENLSNTKMQVLKKCIKLFKNIIYILILYIYMPEIFINNSNINNDNDKMLFMACFVIFSGIMSYILQNYQCKPPESASNIAYNIDDVNNIEVTG